MKGIYLLQNPGEGSSEAFQPRWHGCHATDYWAIHVSLFSSILFILKPLYPSLIIPKRVKRVGQATLPSQKNLDK
jgi:hypothetical protein